MSDNMKIWDAVSRPPDKALKPIRGGRLTGKSDINPQWRYQAMTAQFGPCGIGWRYTIDKLWTEPGVDGVVFAFAQVSVQVKDGGEWSAPIPGIGGHKMIEAEKSGLYCNDECFKMATTDALGVALKMLGVAAEIYLGNYDGSKYLTPPAEEVRQQAELKARATASVKQVGMSILDAAAQKGIEALALAWKTLTQAQREACLPEKDAFKIQAQAVDAARKDGNHAPVG